MNAGQQRTRETDAGQVRTSETIGPEVALDPLAVPVTDQPVGHAGTRVDINETRAFAVSGFLALLGGIALLGLGTWALLSSMGRSGSLGEAPDPPTPAAIAIVTLSLLLAVLLFASVSVIQPGQSKVVQFFGRYIGTARRTGLTMLLPLTTRRTVSLRVNNFETSALKVNDADGNPVEIAAIVVWQVADTARATFSVEDYQNFVRVQAEAALRHVAVSHPYDEQEGRKTSLRGSTDVVSAELALEVAQRIVVAGVEIIEVRISHLAYAPEIAQAMLQRQQANAIVAARSRIVEGAVGMVDMALARLEEKALVDLDDERKATMVSNLLVVLCGEQKVTPVINTGSLYT